MVNRLFSLCAILAAILPLAAHQSFNRHEGEQIGWTSLFSLPQSEINRHFRSVEKEIEGRWNQLGADWNFPPYLPNRDETSLVDEFYRFSNLRIHLWLQDPSAFPCQSNPLFKISQDHLLAGRFRQPCCITFEHSATDPSYNSSSLQIGKRRFFALEGPTETHLPYFFRFLANWRASFLVCLTDETDSSGTPKCFPYWQDRMIEKEGEAYLRFPIDGPFEQPSSTWGKIEIPYLFWPDWEDHHGVDPQQLIRAVNRVRSSVDEGDVIAVHCSGGVGRTGTFIAAICLLDSIDEQLARGIAPSDLQIDIAQLFLYLNFHRPWLVAKPSQYVTLYKTVDWYLSHL